MSRERAFELVGRVVHQAGVHGRFEVSWDNLTDEERRTRTETAALVLAASDAQLLAEIERLELLLIDANDAYDEATGDYPKELVDGEPWRAYRSDDRERPTVDVPSGAAGAERPGTTDEATR